MVDGLFDYLPKEKIVAALERSPGNEIDSGKFASPESSAALAVNAFGFFVNRPHDLPEIPETDECGWPSRYVAIEECVRFPWSGGHHPWLDAFVETETHIVGIESKRFEPFRTKPKVEFSGAYWRNVWGDSMGAFKTMRDRLVEGDLIFERLDAAQLVKHAFGLRTEGQRRGKWPHLVYLYAEPTSWPDGRQVDDSASELHVHEAQRFAAEVKGAEVIVTNCTYRALLSKWQNSSVAELRAHACNVLRSFEP